MSNENTATAAAVVAPQVVAASPPAPTFVVGQEVTGVPTAAVRKDQGRGKPSFVLVEVAPGVNALLPIGKLAATRALEDSTFDGIEAAIKAKNAQPLVAVVEEVGTREGGKLKIVLNNRKVEAGKLDAVVQSLVGTVVQAKLVGVAKTDKGPYGLFLEVLPGVSGLLHVTELCDAELAKLLANDWRSDAARGLRDTRLANLIGQDDVAILAVKVKSVEAGADGKVRIALSEAAVYFDKLPKPAAGKSSPSGRGGALDELRAQYATAATKQWHGTVVQNRGDSLIVAIGAGVNAVLSLADAGFKTGAPGKGSAVKGLVITSISDDGVVKLHRVVKGGKHRQDDAPAPAKKGGKK